jgi:L,D-peptidoglycan transpeptidase YkuD (ErfK/YbiS/YcfS/YnhG family)
MRGRQLALGGVIVALLAALVPAQSGSAATTAAAATKTTTATRVTPAAASTSAPSTTAYAPLIPTVTRWRVPARVRQVIVVRAARWSTTYGTLTLYSRTTGAWHRVVTWPARLGYTGMVIGTKRVQDSGKTPAGQYLITQTFGRRANPGTRMAYTRVTTNHW